jgi:hypothetical protein
MADFGQGRPIQQLQPAAPHPDQPLALRLLGRS